MVTKRRVSVKLLVTPDGDEMLWKGGGIEMPCGGKESETAGGDGLGLERILLLYFNFTTPERDNGA